MGLLESSAYSVPSDAKDCGLAILLLCLYHTLRLELCTRSSCFKSYRCFFFVTCHLIVHMGAS